jgi:hypothetical protein
VDEDSGGTIPSSGYSLVAVDAGESLGTGEERLEIIGNLRTPSHPTVRDALKRSRFTTFVSVGPPFLNDALREVPHHSSVAFRRCNLDGVTGFRLKSVKFEMCSLGDGPELAIEAASLHVAFPCDQNVWLPTARSCRGLWVDANCWLASELPFEVLSSECQFLEDLSIEKAYVTIADILRLCTLPELSLGLGNCRFLRRHERRVAKTPIRTTIKLLILGVEALRGRDLSLLVESLRGLEELHLQVPLGTVVARSLRGQDTLRRLWIPRCLRAVADQGIVLPQVTSLFVPPPDVDAAPWIWSVFPNAKEDYYSQLGCTVSGEEQVSRGHRWSVNL